MKKILLITGDPNSINSEIIFKTIKKLDKRIKDKIFLISNFDLLKEQFKALNFNQKIVKVKNLDNHIKSDYLKVFDIKLKFKNPFNVSKKEASRFVLNSLNFGHKLAINNIGTALINCPVNKRLLNNKGIGVTEYLARKNQITDKSEVMLIKNKQLAVCPITTHEDIKNVSKKLNENIIIKKIKRIDDWYKLFVKKKPKIAVLGLNPHNAEFRNNSEELKIIAPAIKKLVKARVNVFGPLVSDTIFIQNYKKFDVIVGMFHDQVLSPFKALYKFDAINLTLGLKYLRASPDHGTAIDLIKKNKASSKSLERCVEFINKKN